MKKHIKLRTPFEVGDIPLSEYPRPQFQRDSYFTLNGKWQYAIYRSSERFDGYQGEILVPFSPESLLSGLPEGTLVSPNDVLYYHRTFTLPSDFIKSKTFIHFGAVDYACKVTVNGIVVGEHFGGYTPFSFDLTGLVFGGKNTIDVVVTDPSDTSYHSRGKQALKNGKIWYTPQSGIWQSVWLESVPDTYLKDLTIIPDIDNHCVYVRLDKPAGTLAEIIVADNGVTLSKVACDRDMAVISMTDYQLWCPENPKLYDIVIKVGDDVVKSYFGMRKFSIVTDKLGFKRLGLNNKPYFHKGVLDQGYWSDGMLTPPSNAALEYDVKLVKSMGFNMIRKHIKIEPLRWYYHCDKEGILVWQDMVSGGEKYNFLYIGFLAFLEKHIKDDNPSQYRKLARQNEDGRAEFENEVRETMHHLKNVVSLSVWVPFNEGWGQFDSVRITKEMKKIDNTRIIDSVSGWNDQGKDSSDLKSRHIYFKPITVPRKDPRCYVLSEFGGYSLPVKDHMFSPNKIFGYRVYKTTDALADGFKNLYEKSIIPLIDKGLSATVYTQVSDVEEEINGLVTYDRKVVKFPLKLMKSLNDKLNIEE